MAEISLSDYLKVGRVKDAHSLKGEIFVSLFSGRADWLDSLETLVLTPPKPDPLPEEIKEYNIKRRRPHKKGLIVHPEGVSDRTQAEALKGYWFYIPKSLLVSEPGEEIYLYEILHFDVFLNDEKVGQVVDFSSNTAQDLLVIKTSKGRFDVPFVDAFIVRLDFAKKELAMDLPEGLVEY